MLTVRSNTLDLRLASERLTTYDLPVRNTDEAVVESAEVRGEL